MEEIAHYGLGLIVLVVVSGAIISLFSPSDPNYEAGKAEGRKFLEIESGYGAVTKTPQHHTGGTLSGA